MVHWSHPMFLGYFGWTSTAPGILGEILSAPLNVNAMTWRTCPAATELETVVVDWLRQWVGLPDELGGVVYDTASVAIMHALAVAREEAAPSTRKLGLSDRDLPRFRIYTSDQAHSAAEKAAIALGIGEDNVTRVPSDDQFRMDVNSLGRSVAEDRQNGFHPMAVVATVGTTATASVDAIPEIAKICREQKMWLHIDGAYGGGFAIVPEYKWLSNGWELADSVVINPHKTVFVPLDFSVLYVRGLERLRRVFTLVPEVLRGDTIEGEKNYMDYGIQLGRRFRALKAWVIWRSLGRAGVVVRLREQIRLANLLADWIREDDRFELSAQPSMGVVCFRFAGAAAPSPRAATATQGRAGSIDRIDGINSDIVERINASGRAYLTQTKLRGRTVMRIGLGNVLTTEEHLRMAWRLIRETTEALFPGRPQ
jgi:aromatic-L-amino-acid/L-tryptophan decarboxylase